MNESLRVGTGRRGRLSLDETAARALSRRKPGPIYPGARAAERWTPAFAGGAFDMVCRHEPPFFLLGAERRSKSRDDRKSGQEGPTGIKPVMTIFAGGDYI